MTITHTTIRTAALALTASSPAVLFAQAPAAPDVELPESRRIPAEQQAAAYKDPKWKAPRTSWGDPSLDGIWSTDDMRGIPRDRPAELGTQETLPEAQFLQRATSQHTGRDRAANDETFLRNEWGTRTFGFTSLVVDPPDGRTPPANDAGRARAQASAGRGTFGPGPFETFDDFSLYDRCIALGVNRGMGAAIYGNGIRVFQSPTTVTITYEMIHETRVIPLDGRPHLDDAVKQYTGNGRGHWEGDTLVIDTIGYNDKFWMTREGLPHTAQLHTTERISRPDFETLRYEVTIDDPGAYTETWSGGWLIPWVPGNEPFDYLCQENNLDPQRMVGPQD
jgi:hypothetical protein